MVEAQSGTKDMDEREYSESEYKELTKLYESTLNSISEGEIVKGKVVRIADNQVTVDIGFKSEGTIPVNEFPHIKEMKIGDEIEVFLESVENKDGQLILSRKRSDFMRIWERVIRSHTTGELVRGRCVRRTKGGLVADLFGLDAFLPGSQI